jgi:hypothetical protein
MGLEQSFLNYKYKNLHILERKNYINSSDIFYINLNGFLLTASILMAIGRLRYNRKIDVLLSGILPLSSH